ncbi:MAG: hypothetical protein NWT02_11430 [Opitutales bacterium]|jgi:hypothetical protein|nr:hypothetical protein [Opitutales bacterium]
MHNNNRHSEHGFALVIALTLMAFVLTLMLSLSTLLRVEQSASAQAIDLQEARSNAELGIMLALGELQKHAGDDRRVTADASILNGAALENVVGVWGSWSPKMREDPVGTSPDYGKDQHFKRWLISGIQDDLIKVDWVNNPLVNDSVELFNTGVDGFTLSAPKQAISATNQDGGYAWAVVQENTKAKISVAGPEDTDLVTNDALQAQPRPNVSLRQYFSQPAGEWNYRAGRVLNLRQAALDSELGAGGNATTASLDFTTRSFGVLSNVVDGGLKVDLSLGFEMSQSNFHQAKWTGADGTFDNPFHADSESAFSTPSTYDDQRPLYQPLSNSGTVVYQRPGFNPANVQFDFPVNIVPTFDSLRSFYRSTHYLYNTVDGVTLFERESDHTAATNSGARSGWFKPPADSMDGQNTQIGFRPVLDRLMFVVSAGLGPSDDVRIVFTPVITLWNPYNTALEIEGATAYMWFDCPFTTDWRFYNPRGNEVASYTNQLFARLIGHHLNTARSVFPYFYAAITADGNPISGTAEPIRFEPGEVRVFAPASTDLVDFFVSDSPRDRTVFLRPVDNPSQLSGAGGIAIPTENTVRNKGFTRALGSLESVEFSFRAQTADNWPFYISLADATTAKGSGPADGGDDHGKSITEILSDTFVTRGSVEAENTTAFKSHRIPYAEISAAPVPIGVLESYHRVALTSPNQPAADLLYTGNPRQPWMNSFITGTSFATGPQYHTRMRAITDFSEVLETDNGGRSAYYGASHSAASGETYLSFFDIPQAPMLSLAGLQHADLSASPFSPANQFGNSWVSAYVERNKVSDNTTNGAYEVDTAYLLNESLWDGWFFSGAAPTLTFTSSSGAASIWDDALDNGLATETETLNEVITGFLSSPLDNPLRNPRMAFYRGSSEEVVATDLLSPVGSIKFASHLMVDGAFNVNSTSIEAWKAVLAGLREATIEIDGSEVAVGTGQTPFPRLRDPKGIANNNWHGYRTLTDAEIETLATNLVDEIIERGPFLSLAEFVNRRISLGSLGLKGALQAAIDSSGVNVGSSQSTPFPVDKFEASERSNLTDNDTDTSVGIPGYLTQADVLHSMAPILTVRSDTFTIRSYGEVRDLLGNINAVARIEATVQRVPELVDSADKSYEPMSDWNQTNLNFGRKFRVVSVRYLSEDDV